MAVDISIDWGTSVITVFSASLSITDPGPPEVREMDVNELHLALKDKEDDAEGIGFLKTHNHNTQVDLAGVTYARIIEILDPYTITFQDGQYAVNLVGANNNVAAKANVNQVSIRSNNSAGLIAVTTPSGSGATPEAIAAEVWDTVLVEHTASGTTGKALDDIVNASGSGASPSAIADAVWDATVVDHTGSDTFGEKVGKKLLTFIKWFALKD